MQSCSSNKSMKHSRLPLDNMIKIVKFSPLWMESIFDTWPCKWGDREAAEPVMQWWFIWIVLLLKKQHFSESKWSRSVPPNHKPSAVSAGRQPQPRTRLQLPVRLQWMESRQSLSSRRFLLLQLLLTLCIRLHDAPLTTYSAKWAAAPFCIA